MSIRVITGDRALALMEVAAYQKEWQNLYETCPWATSAQRPDFTYLRCAMYRSKAEPVIVEQRNVGSLVGVLALARPVGGEKTLGATCEDGEYHVWVTDREHAESFMPEALSALWVETNLPPIRLRYVPAGAPLEWVRSEPWKSRCVLRPVETPVLRLESREKAQCFVQSKSRLRTKRNQLRRLGHLTFRRIEGITDFEGVLNRFVEMYNARKLARIGSTVFDSDPIKRNYLIACQRAPGLQHTTVLDLDGKAIAAHIGIEGRPGGTFSLAGITHDPAYDKYSPGSLLLAELIPMLCEEGYSAFDLTPGGDAYKERWGDSVETVYDLRIYSSRLRRYADATRNFPQRAIRKLGRLIEGVRRGDPK